MPNLSQRSLNKLVTCHQDLILIAHEAIKEIDFSVICGYRGEHEQNQAYRLGNSKLKYPQSKHNKKPSMAFDLMPYPPNKRAQAFHDLAQVILRISEDLRETGKIKHKVRWGGDWDMDGDLKDNKFNDLYHFELI